MFLLQPNATKLFSVSDLQLIAPELILTVCACIALVMEVILPYRKSKLIAYFSLIGVGLAMASLWVQFAASDSLPIDGFYGMIRIDGFALVFQSIFLIGAGLAIAISTRYLDIEGEQHGEYYALVLFATVGMMFWAAASIDNGLRSWSDGAHVLCWWLHNGKRSNEAAMNFSAGSLFIGCCLRDVLLYGSPASIIAEIGRSVRNRSGVTTGAIQRPH